MTSCALKIVLVILNAEIYLYRLSGLLAAYSVLVECEMYFRTSDERSFYYYLAFLISFLNDQLLLYNWILIFQTII